MIKIEITIKQDGDRVGISVTPTSESPTQAEIHNGNQLLGSIKALLAVGQKLSEEAEVADCQPAIQVLSNEPLKQPPSAQEILGMRRIMGEN